jgi:hypothetical protein
MAMDKRSQLALFVPAAYEDGTKRRVVLWVFPNEEALRVSRTQDGAAIEVLRDVFSQRSRLRKAAHFEGRELRTDFLGGRVLDYQAGSANHDVASFWIERFLTCTYSLTSDAGSRMLARAIRQLHEEFVDRDDREQLYAAAVAMRRSPHKTISFDSFAERYLQGELVDRFLGTAPTLDARSALFDFSREAFDAVLHFRVFQLQNGTFVSAPLAVVGKDRDVRLTGVKQDHLVCEGRVIDERVRARHD